MAEPAGRPPSALRVGVALFNAGEYFEQHEVFEDLWRAESGPLRELYQGILQVGVGLHHLRRGNHHGAVTLIDRGLARLGRIAPDEQGIDVAGLVLATRRLRQELERLGPARLEEIPGELLPKIVWLRP